MSSNAGGGKKRRAAAAAPTSTSSAPNGTPPNANALQLPTSLADFSGVNPLLLVAAAYSPSLLHRQLLQQQLQQAQQQLDKQRQSQSSTPNGDERDVASAPPTHADGGAATDGARSGRSSGVWPTSPSILPAHLPSVHKIRKLKLYSVDEKIDIIDYAKVIGNRAAGREFNVAESSIREWRKNEDRLRRQSESSTNGAPRLEIRRADLIEQLDDQLVEFVDGAVDVDWYAIRDKARDLWPPIAETGALDEAEPEMQITMGWVTRFMKRNEHRIRRIAPPVIATAAAASNNGSAHASLSMVRKTSPFAGLLEGQTAVQSSTNSSNPSPTSSTSPSPVVVVSTGSRRKCAQPRRAADATLLLTPEKEKLPIGEKNGRPTPTDEEPADKKPKLDFSPAAVDAKAEENDEQKAAADEKTSLQDDSGIQLVC
ncbi:HTH CENPB-type domain-containing protein [Aphelenchoides fujianensis]|nr:HTH CENPB-type domain-containing protein [Aphelenchoides fujianensis]